MRSSSTALSQTVIDANFSQGDFSALGWQAKGAWDVYEYPGEVKNNPGKLARFAANQPDGWLSYAFAEVHDPKQLTLSLNYGWGWGDAGQGSDSASFMLLDHSGAGYFFRCHRVKARWAVQWGKVVDRAVPSETVWARDEIDGSHPSVRDGGGLIHLTITARCARRLDDRQPRLERRPRRRGVLPRRHHQLVPATGDTGHAK